MKHQAKIWWKELRDGHHVCHTWCAFQYCIKGMGGMSEDAHGCAIGCSDPKEFDAAPDKTKCPGPGVYDLKKSSVSADDFIEKPKPSLDPDRARAAYKDGCNRGAHALVDALGVKREGKPPPNAFRRVVRALRERDTSHD